MIARKLILSVLTLLLACGSAATWSQTGGDRWAEELNTLRQQQRQLERDVAQYQQSIDVLRGEGSGENEQSAALQTLEDQLRRTQQALVAMARQETELVRQLLPSVAAPAPEPEQILDDPEAEEVARLKALLHEYHATQALAAAADSDDNRADGGIEQADVDSLANKIRLTGPEGMVAIGQISQRLADTAIPTLRREFDIVFHIEVRRKGKLVSSSSHNLKSLGKSQYIGKVSLAGGTATLTVRKDAWTVDLLAESASDYLVTLKLAHSDPPVLHVIPMEELKAVAPESLPDWIPYIGAIPTAASGS